jgi:peptidyl-prolyl cis-trans isomerase SurA
MKAGWGKPIHSVTAARLLRASLGALLIGGGILGSGPVAATADTAEVVDRIVAEVNDDIITLYELQRAMEPFARRVRAMKRPISEERQMLFEVREKVLNQLIDQRLTDQEAKRFNITVSEAAVDSTVEEMKKRNRMTDRELRDSLAREGLSLEEYRQQLKDQMLRARLVNREVKSKIVITEQDIRSCYDANKDKYCGSTVYELRHIIMNQAPGADDATRAAVRQRMEAVLQELEGGAAFADLARRYSESPLAAEGGYLGRFQVQDLAVEIQDALKGLQSGQHTAILSNDRGLQIFYVEQVHQTADRALEDVAAEIEDQLFNDIVNQKFQSWLSELRERSHVKIIR